ncbi:MAG TPA: TonB-dependent receptor [Burkholderiales bacterium]|nr:TonB-dependent receptor [Burkholderiales bacterium]
MRPVRLQLAVCATLLMSCNGMYAAQESSGAGEQTPGVEVTAYRVPVTLQETAQGVTVIDRQEIEIRKPDSVIELLRQVPGVQIDQVGSPGGVSSIYIRGSDPEQVLVLIDGVRVNDPMLSRGGSYDISSIDPALIDRIEVLRGGGSALYGADALGGIVNIVTRRRAEKGIGVELGGGIGGDRYGALHGRVSAGTDQVSANVSLAHLEDGREANGGTLDLDTISTFVTFHPSEAFEARVFFFDNNRDSSSFPDTSGGVRLAVIRTLEQRQAKETTGGIGFKVSPWSLASFNVQLSRYARTEDIDSPGVAPSAFSPFGLPASTTQTDFTRDSAVASVGLRLPLDSDFTVGVEHIDERGVSTGTLALPFPVSPDFSLTRRTNSVFGELKTKPLPELVVLLGARYDRVSQLRSEFSPSVGVRYTLAPTGTTLKARYAKGFRAPSFFALGSPLVGNPDLKPETSKGAEIGVEQRLWNEKLMLGVNVFRTRVKNLIDFDPFAGIFGQLVNRGRVTFRGAELIAEARPIDALAINASYTYVDNKIDDGAGPLRNRPRHRAALALAYRFAEAWQASWTTAYVGEVRDFSIPTGEVKLDDFTRTDVALSYQWRQLTTTLAIDNLFNEHYEQFVGFTVPGRRGRISVSARF